MTAPKSVWRALSVERELAKGFGLVLGFSFLINLLVLTSPLYMMQIYDRVLMSRQIETLVFVSIIALVALMAFGALDAVRTYLLNRIGNYIDAAMRDQVLAGALILARKQGGAAGARLLSDLTEVRSYLGSQNVVPFLDGPWVLFFVAIMALLHPWLGVLGFGAALFLLLLTIINDALTKSPLAAANAQQFKATQFADSILSGAEVVHAMGMQGAAVKNYRRFVSDAAKATLFSSDVVGLFAALSRCSRVVIQSATLGLGAYLVIRAELTPGGMIAASILQGRALAPIEQAIGAWRQFALARISYRRIRDLLQSTPVSIPSIALPDLKGELRLEGVFLQLPGHDRPVLRNIGFQTRPGTALALIGPSASGKSTLCRIIVGALSPSSGKVRIDSAEISEISPGDLSRTIGYLPQNVDLFAGTVSENIARLGQVDDAKVVAAARAAGCHEMILRLSRGYHTELGAQAELSGGQRQRIGLARALYGEPMLLVLDEPNAHLDQDGEKALIDAIVATKRRGATVVIVNHRSTLLHAIDKIGVLRDGALERFGDRDVILRELQPSANKPALVPVADSPGLRT